MCRSIDERTFARRRRITTPQIVPCKKADGMKMRDFKMFRPDLLTQLVSSRDVFNPAERNGSLCRTWQPLS
jgi:hypothetical protein